MTVYTQDGKAFLITADTWRFETSPTGAVTSLILSQDDKKVAEFNIGFVIGVVRS